MRVLIIASALLFASAARSASICALVCPVSTGNDACQLTIDAGKCSCSCQLKDFPDWEALPNGTKVQLDLGGTKYVLATKVSPPQLDLGSDKPSAAVESVADAVIDVLTPLEANPKQEPRTIIVKDDGTIGGWIGDDGEFNPGRPDWLKN